MKNENVIHMQTEIKKEKTLKDKIDGIKVIYRDFTKDFKRGTKAPHNPDLADPKTS
jgi:hypothetical protein